ncbi:unnamed protein product [Sphacelaria rigidula]
MMVEAPTVLSLSIDPLANPDCSAVAIAPHQPMITPHVQIIADAHELTPDNGTPRQCKTGYTVVLFVSAVRRERRVCCTTDTFYDTPSPPQKKNGQWSHD